MPGDQTLGVGLRGLWAEGRIGKQGRARGEGEQHCEESLGQQGVFRWMALGSGGYGFANSAVEFE